MLYLTKKSFEKVFDPSSCAASFDGPKVFIFLLCRKSVKPITRGCSGPIITNSIFSLTQNFSMVSKSFESISTLLTLFSR